MATKVCAIAAMDQGRAIGKENDIPWNYPEDMKHFATSTAGAAVLMGRKTYDSLPPNFKPLPKRENIVVTRSPEALAGEPVRVITEVERFVADLKSGVETISSDTLWVVGGEQIYRLTQAFWDEVLLTRIQKNYGGDTFFPEFETDFHCEESRESDDLVFERWVRNKTSN